MRGQHFRIRRGLVPTFLVIFILFMTYHNFLRPIQSEELTELDLDDDHSFSYLPPKNHNPNLSTAIAPSTTPPVASSNLEDQQPFDPSSRSQHVFRADGYLEVNPAGRHPIFSLVERAEVQWQQKLNRQSKSLSEAFVEYQRRYGRKPPPGFDKW